MNIKGMIKPTMIFYGIIITIIMVTVVANKMSLGTVSMSGIEASTVIFLFVCGLNSFKTNFYFAKSNNISRKTFIKGILISTLPIAFVTSILDIIVNRITNIFISNPTFYDMSYGEFYNAGGWSSGNTWIQSNSLGTIFNTILFQFTLCLVAYLIGLVINMIYYRCNKMMKTVVSVAPIAVIIIINTLAYNFPEIVINISRFINFIFGLDPINVYAAITTFIVISIALALASFMLIRKAVIKER